MQRFRINMEDRRCLAPHHHLFQTMLAILSSEKLGCEWDQEFVDHYEGGIRVNDRNIIVQMSAVFDLDIQPCSLNATAEEVVVAETISDIVDQFRIRGPALFSPYIKRSNLVSGDPLRSLLTDYYLPISA